jgi:superfamily II DNA helicase RecQ
MVISASVDWMEAEAAKLRERDLSAACIHAGRDRESLRAACIDYLNGRLEFLYVAPERFSVPGFPEMLAKRRPALIAIEDAHRVVPASAEHLAEYDLLCRHLSVLRPAPVIALTKSSNQSHQKEIPTRLGLNL